MLDLFRYNWQVREDWFDWCEHISHEELIKEQIGGIGTILQNLFHVINCEQIWISHMKGVPQIITDKSEITTLQHVEEFHTATKPTTEEFLAAMNEETLSHILTIPTKKDVTYELTYKKVFHHIITHEIHHIGQLSIWSRELGIKPVSSDLIIREYI